VRQILSHCGRYIVHKKRRKKKINNVLVTVDQEKKSDFEVCPKSVFCLTLKKTLKKNLLHTYYKKKVKMCNTYIPIAKFSLFVKLKKEKKIAALCTFGLRYMPNK